MSTTGIELLDEPDHFSSVRLSKNTIKRLDSKGRYRDSYESIINRILDEKEGIDINPQERSF